MNKLIATIALAAAGTLLAAPAVMAAPAAPAAPALPPVSAAAVTGAAGASATLAGAETKISGPAKAKVGVEFKINGTTDKALKGQKVTAYQDGKKIAATRTVGNTGDISMRIVSGKLGKAQAYQFQVVDGAGNVWKSNTITINVTK